MADSRCNGTGWVVWTDTGRRPEGRTARPRSLAGDDVTIGGIIPILRRSGLNESGGGREPARRLGAHPSPERAKPMSVVRARQIAARNALAHRRELQREQVYLQEATKAEKETANRVHARARQVLQETISMERLIQNAELIQKAEHARAKPRKNHRKPSLHCTGQHCVQAVPSLETAEEQLARTTAEGVERATRELERAKRQSASGIADGRAHRRKTLEHALNDKRAHVTERPWAAALSGGVELDEDQQAHRRMRQLERELQEARFAARFRKPNLARVAVEVADRWQRVRREGADLGRIVHERSARATPHATAHPDRLRARGQSELQAAVNPKPEIT